MVSRMRALLQRVASAQVTIAGERVAEIGRGLLILLGVGPDDGPEDVVWLSGKIARMRIFPDSGGKMNLAVREVGGGCLVVSQFTLFADVATGNRPAFTGAARPEVAIPLYEDFLAQLATDTGSPVPCGRFGADMQVALVNDGPVTLLIDSRQRR
jgi:D-tyrosyl-tRNA(Tyr) deacylase